MVSQSDRNEKQRGMVMDKKIGFIGCGNMGKAILGGLIASGQVQPGQIWVYTPSPDKVAALRDQYGINAASSAQEVAQIADIVFGAVKPGIMTSAGRYRLQPE